MLTPKELTYRHIKSNPNCVAVDLKGWVRIRMTELLEIIAELKKENRIKEVKGRLMVI